MKLKIVISMILFLALAVPAQAYQLKPGDLLFKPIVGAKVNFFRFDAATRESSAGGLVLGLEAEYAFSADWTANVTLMPALWLNTAEANAAVGMKYRFNNWNAPLIPYLGAELLVNMNSPLRTVQEFHWGPGARIKCGMDYFVSKNFAVNTEFGISSRLQIQPEIWPELGATVLLGFVYRL